MTLWIHLGFMLGGLAGFLTSVACAMMYLFQSSQLKSKHPGKISLKLPSLGTLDKIHFVSLTWGVVLFSLGILSGFFWATNLSAVHQVLREPKVVLSLATCVLYWIVFSVRLSSLRRGQKIALGTMFIFILLFLTLMSSYYAPSGFHKGF